MLDITGNIWSMSKKSPKLQIPQGLLQFDVQVELHEDVEDTWRQYSQFTTQHCPYFP